VVEFSVESFKSILNVRRYIDGWFWDRYSINPYNGCQFGCVYCNSRSDRYRMPADFEHHIVVKATPAELLERRLARARTLLPDVVALSGVTDPYQPAERKYRSTRQLLEVLRSHAYPVHIITKSLAVLEDIELLDAIGAATWCTVSVTLSTTNEAAAGFLDGSAPSPAERLDLVRALRERAPNVQVGVLAIPVAPYLGDDDEDLERLVDGAVRSGAQYLLFGGGMTLRDAQGDWFRARLEERHPHLVARYAELYGDRHEPSRDYLGRVHRVLRARCEVRGLSLRIPRYVPADYRASNYRVAESLLCEAYERQLRGEPFESLHWAGQHVQNLRESIEDVAARGELETIRNVRGPVLERVRALLGD
jgi:DNA repair photolyase